MLGAEQKSDVQCTMYNASEKKNHGGRRKLRVKEKMLLPILGAHLLECVFLRELHVPEVGVVVLTGRHGVGVTEIEKQSIKTSSFLS